MPKTRRQPPETVAADFKSKAEAVRADFDARGESIADWCMRHGVKPYAAYRVLAADAPPRRGELHRAAVLLGLKPGTTGTPMGAR